MHAHNAQAPARLAAVAARAAAINLSLNAACLGAGIKTPHRTTIRRWADGSIDPRVSLFETTMAKLEQWLAAEEVRIAMNLGGRAA